MKFSFIILAIAALSVASCKKDRVCECKTQTDIPGLGSFSDTKVTTLKDVTPATANRACIHRQLEETENGVTTKIDIYCELK